MKLLKYMLCLLVLPCFGQKYDYNWIIGLASGNPPEPQYTLWGPTQFDFSSDTLNVFSRFRPLDMSYSSIAGCNREGVLQFYTNCLQINDTDDVSMPNGTGLNPGEVADEQLAVGMSYRSNRAATIITKPNSDSIYYLFHTAWVYDSLLPEGAVDSYFYYTVIDMNVNNGLGAVIDKNHILVGDYIVGDGGWSACKHANGRDWWILMPKLFTNCFYQFLLTPSGIDSLGLQCTGDTFQANTDEGASCYTPDGSKYIWSNPYDSLHILDFDRCTGLLSNSRRIAVYDSLGTAIHYAFFDGTSVSPNSRYLYVTSGTDVWQFDLWADDIGQSQILIGNVSLPDPLSSTQSAQLAPDGKIYINPIGQDTFFHVINTPDSPGLACQFQKNGLRTPTYHWDCMPLYPNYRLGPVEGSVCDTLGLDSLNNSIHNLYSESVLKVYPNPAADYVIIDYGFTNWSKGGVSLEVLNSLGQRVYRQVLPMYSGFQRIDVSGFASGVYMAVILRDNERVAAGKFVRE